MLRPVSMSRIEIAAMKEFKDGVIKRLHELGVVQIMEYKGSSESEEILKSMPVDPIVRDTSKLIRGMSEIIEVYDEVKPEPSEGILKKNFTPLPPKRIEIVGFKNAKKEEIIRDAENTLLEVKGEIEETLVAYRELGLEINELQTSKEPLKRIKELDIELKYVNEGYYVSIFLGVCPEDALETVISDLKEVTSGLYYFESVKSGENEFACVVACFNENVEEVLTRLRRDGFERIELEFEGKPLEEIEAIERRIKEKELEQENVKRILAESAEKREDDLAAYRGLLRILEERGEIQRSFGETEQVIFLRGWIPAENVDEVSKEVNKISNGLCAINAASPEPEEEEDVPVLLKNPKFFKSFEILTKLYGTPKYNGIDPTLLLTPTFIFFFALMLADALYGLICMIFGILLLRGIGRYNEMMKDASIVLTSVGVATFVIGALTGGWFGDFAIEYLHLDMLKSLIILDPLRDVNIFLVFVLLIGIVHLDLGIITKIIYDIKRGMPKEALKGNLWFIIAQIGLIPFIMRSMNPGGAESYGILQMTGVLILIVSFISLLWSHKVMFFFGITGAIGDVLSYARLMALSLCTFGIAMAVNILAGLCNIVLGVIVFIFGHTLNFAINVLGSFVHGIRLEYVEFFTKFYDAGGDEFHPFKERRESVVFK
ncbi:MAG: V-type ATP synthase subunit I [Euryarchaeota archaeon]|nr:V-type ATP synthase subunit I [Euryarchaeota archaeon]